MNWPQDKAGTGREMRQDSAVTAANPWKLAKACFLWFRLVGWLSTCRAQPAAGQDKRDLKAQVAPRSQAHVDDPVSVEDASQEPASQPEAKPAEKPDEKWTISTKSGSTEDQSWLHPCRLSVRRSERASGDRRCGAVYGQWHPRFWPGRRSVPQEGPLRAHVVLRPR